MDMIDESVLGQLVKKAVKRKGIKLGEVAVESPFGRPSEIRWDEDVGSDRVLVSD